VGNLLIIERLWRIIYIGPRPEASTCVIRMLIIDSKITITALIVTTLIITWVMIVSSEANKPPKQIT
jgi:hypothetical protein